jgi:hypothetical protein
MDFGGEFVALSFITNFLNLVILKRHYNILFYLLTTTLILSGHSLTHVIHKEQLKL